MYNIEILELPLSNKETGPVMCVHQDWRASSPDGSCGSVYSHKLPSAMSPPPSYFSQPSRISAALIRIPPNPFVVLLT